MGKRINGLHPFDRTDFAGLRVLADKAGCSVSHLCNIKAGRKLPSLPLARKLAKAMRIRAERFDYPR